MHFAQIGPPRNLTIQQTDAGDEFIASWYPPDYGMDTLAVYVLRWHRQPGYKFEGSLETRNTYIRGKIIVHILFCLPHPEWFLVPCS